MPAPQQRRAVPLEPHVIVVVEVVEAEDDVALLVHLQRGVEADKAGGAGEQHDISPPAVAAFPARGYCCCGAARLPNLRVWLGKIFGSVDRMARAPRAAEEHAGGERDGKGDGALRHDGHCVCV